MPAKLRLSKALLTSRIRRVDPKTGCWIYDGRPAKNGYCRIGKEYVHRVAARLWGKLKPGSKAHVRHTCDIRRCFNPSHLKAGTNYDNVQDCVRKCRHAFGTKNGRAKLTPAKVRMARQLRPRGWTYQRIADKLGVSYTNAWLIINRRRWIRIA